MEIVLKKKLSNSDKDPLVVVLEPEEGLAKEQRVKKIFKVEIGEVLNLDDTIAYQILGKYKNLFEIVQSDLAKPGYKTKIAKPDL